MLSKNQNQKQRQTNETYRDREYLEPHEIQDLIEAAGARGRYKERDRISMIIQCS